MAISLLDSGNSGAVATNATTTVPVNVTTGAGNRKLLIGISLECSVAGVAPATVNFNGQDLVALGLEVSGTNQNPNSLARTVFYEQFEAGLPASGSTDITVTWTGTSGGAGVFYWLVDGVRQDQLATGAGNNVLAAGSAGTTIGTTIAAADTGAFLAAVAYKNNATGTLVLTAPASSTANGDLSVTGGARCAGGSKLGSLTAGSNTVTFTHDSQQRRCLSAVVVEPAPDTRTISGGLTLGAVTVSGDVDHEPATVSGGFSTGAVGVSGDVDHEPAEVSGGFTLGAVQITGTVQGNTEATVSGGLVTPSVTVDATATIIGRSRVGGPTLTMPGVDADGALSNLANVAGAVQLGAVTVTGTVAHAPANISGGIVLGAVQVGGGLLTQFPGSCVLLDFPAGSVELFDELAGAATLQDEPTGSVTLEFVE